MERLDAVDDEQRADRRLGVVGIEHELRVGARQGECDGRVAFTPHLGEAETIAVEGERGAEVGGRDEQELELHGAAFRVVTGFAYSITPLWRDARVDSGVDLPQGQARARRRDAVRGARLRRGHRRRAGGGRRRHDGRPDHHFGSKLGLYAFVRADVEQRLLDRLEGAIAASPTETDRAAAVKAALMIGFDFAVRERFSASSQSRRRGRNTTGWPRCSVRALPRPRQCSARSSPRPGARHSWRSPTAPSRSWRAQR